MHIYLENVMYIVQCAKCHRLPSSVALISRPEPDTQRRASLSSVRYGGRPAMYFRLMAREQTAVVVGGWIVVLCEWSFCHVEMEVCLMSGRLCWRVGGVVG